MISLDEDYTKLATKMIGDKEKEWMDDVRRQRGMAPRVPEDKGVVPPAPAAVPGAGSAMAPGAPAPQTINPAKTGPPAPAQQVGSQMKPPLGSGGITDVAGIKPDFKKAEYYERTSPQYAELFKAEMELEEMEKGSGKMPNTAKKDIKDSIKSHHNMTEMARERDYDAEEYEQFGDYKTANEKKDSAAAGREMADLELKLPVARRPKTVLKSDIEEIDKALEELEKKRK